MTAQRKRGLNGKSKDIIIGQDKTQAYTGTYHNNTRQTKYLNKYYLFFTVATKNFFKCLHLLISSDILFRRSLVLRNLISHSA